MKEIKFKLDLLLDSLNVRCKYYQGDEESCLKAEKIKHEGWLTCNCDGYIQKCDLWKESKNETD